MQITIALNWTVQFRDSCGYTNFFYMLNCRYPLVFLGMVESILSNALNLVDPFSDEYWWDIIVPAIDSEQD